MNDLRCTLCDYDLRGLRLVKGRIRCPECGARTDLDSLASEIVQRRRRRRTFRFDLTIMIATALTLAILSVIMREISGADALRTRLEFLASTRGVMLALLLTGVIFVLSYPRWFEIPGGDRLTFAVGSTFLLLVVPFPLGVILLTVWIGGFHVWSTRLTSHLRHGW